MIIFGPFTKSVSGSTYSHNIQFSRPRPRCAEWNRLTSLLKVNPRAGTKSTALNSDRRDQIRNFDPCTLKESLKFEHRVSPDIDRRSRPQCMSIVCSIRSPSDKCPKAPPNGEALKSTMLSMFGWYHSSRFNAWIIQQHASGFLPCVMANVLRTVQYESQMRIFRVGSWAGLPRICLAKRKV